MYSIFCRALAVLLAYFLVAPSPAQGLMAATSPQGFRNDTSNPVVIQLTCVVQGVLTQTRPSLVRAGETSPRIDIPARTNKVITVYDARTPNRILFQSAFPGADGVQLYRVKFDMQTGRLKVELQ